MAVLDFARQRLAAILMQAFSEFASSMSSLKRRLITV